MFNKLFEMIGNGLINLNIYSSMVFALGRRHPKMVTILGLLAFCAICAAHLSLYGNSKPFFGLAAIISGAIALTLIVFYDNEEQPRDGRRHPILETEKDWFSEIEQH